jgi:hypothetical protein
VVVTQCSFKIAESEDKYVLTKIRFEVGMDMNEYNQRLSRACIVHLVIKRNNWSYVKTMSCSGSHLGIPNNIKNTKFVKDLPMIDAQFRFNQCNSFCFFMPIGNPRWLSPHVIVLIQDHMGKMQKYVLL